MSLRDASVGTVTGRTGFDSRQGHDFSLLHNVQTKSGAHAASYKMGTGGSLPGVKQPGSEADRSPSSSVDVPSMPSWSSA
jgi:hypothetical protein